ncbi:multicopper oxidase family protein [Chishuiella sp.]|uniref:multicopper oxidase family protein n=1 Tax=Chishuiella sp. TaxID=1969467 RepID=UPI0028A7CA7C|nr:multicopper oxidase domain-containing protein [Chishuiella sp.]
MKNIYKIFGFLWFISLHVNAQKKVEYDLYVRDTIVNYSGKPKKAIAVNGQIPMPILEFTEGDTAVIRVHNELKKESTSLHWHGIWLPNKEDGVPWLTQMPIEVGETYTYTFPIIQNGTHWYHSHSGYQEQVGMYGSLILKKRKDDPTFRKGIDDLPEVPVILSDWTDLNPQNVQRMLQNANDWFAIKKGSTQSYAEAIKEGHFKTKIVNEWKRMLAMDVSDVYYEKFAINGHNESQLKQFKAGDKVRLRISNGSNSTYFWLRYGGGKMTVVANDGQDVEPVEVDRLIIGVSETYDVIVTVPEGGLSYELQATSEDRIASTSLFIGEGKKQLLEPLGRLKYFEGMKMMNDMMKMNGSMNDMGMKMNLQQMDMNRVMYPEITGEAKKKSKKSSTKMKDMKGMNDSDENTELPNITTLNYGMLRAPHNTELPKDAPVKELRFELTGNMNRYVWSMNNKVLSEADKIPVKKGEILRITLYNNSMMRHPMHLHGFDFRVLNKNGEYSPLKNVLDIMPMETDVIEFQANTEGDWFFHCHILYHMMAGMNRVFDIGDYKNPNFHHKDHMYKMLQMDSNMKHLFAQNDFASNGLDGQIMVQNARWVLSSEWNIGYKPQDGIEVETHLGRFIDQNQWFQVFVGFDLNKYKSLEHAKEKNIFGQDTNRNRGLFSAGFVYRLPMLVDFQTEIYHNGKVRLQVGREDIPISKRIRAGFMWNTDKEYMGELSYIVNRNLQLRTHYDSDMKFGIGLNLVY